MPTLLHAVPRYRKHRASGQAIVTISGQDHYLGSHGSRASKVEYDRLIAEWLANEKAKKDAAKAKARGEHVEVVLLAKWRANREPLPRMSY